MAVVTKKCYYSNTPKFILFYFYSSSLPKTILASQDPEAVEKEQEVVDLTVETSTASIILGNDFK